MSPGGRSRGKKGRGGEAGPPTGSGPQGRITPGDIEAKINELVGGVEDKVQAARPLLTYAAVGGAVVLAVMAFWLGRRSGRRRSTVVEVRRG